MYRLEKFLFLWLNNIISNLKKLNTMEENQLKQLEECKSYVLSTSKWLKFFGIFTIIEIVCVVIIAISSMLGGSALASTLSGNLPEIKGVTTVTGVSYFIFAGMMVFPTIYIFRAANAGNAAVESNDNAQMVEFLKNIKSYWKFIGIYMIVLFAMLFFILTIALIAAIATIA